MNVQFITSATRKEQYPSTKLPRVAFAGRSNVGKSSLINHLVGRKSVARTSRTPGRTQVINFFNVGDRWIFVDLPGYGYARVPARIRNRWAPMIEEFLLGDKDLRLAVMIIDARREPSELDGRLKQWLESHRIPYQVVATKVDKLKSSELGRSIDRIERELGCPVIAHSTRTGLGKREIWEIIERVTVS